MTPHIWKGVLPRCVRCNCTSLVAQHLQADTRGVGPCPLYASEALEKELLAAWVANQQHGAVTPP